MSKLYRFMLLSILMFCITACSMRDNPTVAQNSGEETEGLTVCAASYPVYDFIQKIAGDKVELIPLFSATVDPHEWEPSPSDIVKLENSDIFIYSGVGFEHWAEAVLNSVKNPDLIIVEAGAGLVMRQGGENNAEHDPHVWLSVSNAKAQLEVIKNALVDADERNRDFYEDNYLTNAQEFDALEKDYRDTAATFSKKEIVVSHEAFGYLCDAYGLTQVGIDGLMPDSEPSPARMAWIIDYVAANNVRVIFFEELASPKVAQAIARATGAETAVLDPIEGLSEERQSSGEEYLSIMRQNLEALRYALE